MNRTKLAVVIVSVFSMSSASFAQTPSQDAPKAIAKQGEPDGGRSKAVPRCRNISADIRDGKPVSKESVVAELVRARAEGEMDFQISSTPPAIYRPMCDLPSAAAPQTAKQ